MADGVVVAGAPTWYRRLPWRAEMVLLLVILLIAVLAVALGGALYVVRTSAQDETEQTALAVARTVASDPRYAAWVIDSAPAPDGPVQRAAEEVRAQTRSLYVVVTNAHGIRFSHPIEANVGSPVSTDPSVPLGGGEETAIEEGTLGWSARGKVPLRNTAGAVVGSVSVGVPIAEVNDLQRRLSTILLVVGGVAFAAGLLALGAFWRRLRRATHGLEPEEMADLLREHAAVLGGALEGIVALDATGNVRICNEAARRYLEADITVGAPAATAGLPEAILAVLAPLPRGPRPRRTVPEGAVAGLQAARLVVAGGRVLDVRRVAVAHDGRDLGVVIVLRDRTDLDDLGRELEATRALTDALRAQTHEHANHLHALSGMLQLGHDGDARTYLAHLVGGVAWNRTVEDPYLAGLLAAKTALASEQGVQVRISEDTWVAGRLERPLDSVTVVGNLLDNAIRAAARGHRRPAWVEVSLLSHTADLLIHIIDSGDGVPAGQEETIFGTGWTTKTNNPGLHGVGLALARVTARRHGGDVSLAARCGADHGAAFGARLASVLRVGVAQT